MRHAGSTTSLAAALLGTAAALASFAAPGGARAAEAPSLMVNGDSYSTMGRSGYANWPSQLKGAGDVSSVTNFARGGATATSRIGTTTVTNSFANQISRWRAAGQPLGDANVVFFGYNDIKNPQITSYTNSRNGYSAGVKALLDAGANSGGRELFLVMPHDVGSFPRFNGVHAGTADTRAEYRRRTQTWNSFVAAKARDTGANLVNLFSVIDRVLADPARYRLTNVTRPDPANAGSTALYHDDIHFGRAGQKIVRQAMRSAFASAGLYAQSVQTSQRAAAEQSAVSAPVARAAFAALDAAEEGGEPLGLVALPVGSTPLTWGTWPGAGEDAAAWAAGGRADTAAGDPATAPAAAQFARAFAPAEAGEGGLALAWALPGGATSVGLVVADHGAAAEADVLAETTGARLASRTVELRVRRELGALELETRLAHGRERHEVLRFDDITRTHDRTAFGGSVLALAQRVGRPVEGETRGGLGYVVTPWAELGREERRVDGFTLESPFAPDREYAASRLGDTLASVGLDARLEPLDLGGGRWLSLWGGLSYTHGLARDDHRVRITEAAFGTTSERTVERPETRAVGLSLGASLALGEALSLDGALALQHDAAGGGGTAEAGRVALTYRF